LSRKNGIDILYQFSRLKIIPHCGGDKSINLVESAARFFLLLACKISRFCRVISIGKAIAEIPPQPPFAKGGRGDFWETSSEGKQLPFFKEPKCYDILY
jgi:hypothetical protein